MLKISISAGGLILMAVLLLILPLNWLASALLAAAIHELFHFLAVYLSGGRISEIRIQSRGAVMTSSYLPPLREFICTLAGPAGSLILLLLARWMPRVAICGFVHGIFNLLPLFPLDGGRMLRCILSAILPYLRAERVFGYLQSGIIVGLIIIICVIAFRFTTFLLIPVFFLLPRLLFGGTIEVLLGKRYGYDRITETNSAHCAETGPVYRR